VCFVLLPQQNEIISLIGINQLTVVMEKELFYASART
jgi:hypothetical protein